MLIYLALSLLSEVRREFLLREAREVWREREHPTDHIVSQTALGVSSHTSSDRGGTSTPLYATSHCIVLSLYFMGH